MAMRRTIIELLMDAFAKREEIFIIDALGQMAGVFQVKEFTNLAEQLRQQLWGYLNTRLGRPPRYKPLPDMMQLDEESMEYAWRAFDLWLLVTPAMPADSDAQYYDEIKKLFENGMTDFFPTEIHFHLLILVFRALIKTNPYYAAKSGFARMCNLVENIAETRPADIYRRGWLGFCREMGVLFKYDKINGKKWREEFKKGLIEIREDIENNELYLIHLHLMDGLDSDTNEVRSKALPRLDRKSPGKGKAYIAPRNPIEKEIAGIWSDVLGFDKISIYDNFFDIGGSSLDIIQVEVSLESTFQVKFPIGEFLHNPHIDELAKKIEIILQASKKNLYLSAGEKDEEDILL